MGIFKDILWLKETGIELYNMALVIIEHTFNLLCYYSNIHPVMICVGVSPALVTYQVLITLFSHHPRNPNSFLFIFANAKAKQTLLCSFAATQWLWSASARMTYLTEETETHLQENPMHENPNYEKGYMSKQAVTWKRVPLCCIKIEGKPPLDCKFKQNWKLSTSLFLDSEAGWASARSRCLNTCLA